MKLVNFFARFSGVFEVFKGSRPSFHAPQMGQSWTTSDDMECVTGCVKTIKKQLDRWFVVVREYGAWERT